MFRTRKLIGLLFIHVILLLVLSSCVDGKKNIRQPPLIIYPTTPNLLNPKPGSIVENTEITFFWSHDKHADNYIFQLATDESFKDKVINKKLPETQIKIIKFDNTGKTYYWRVQSTNKFAESGWSEGHVINGYPRLGKVILKSPINKMNEDKNEIVFEWANAENASKYEIEIYRGGKLWHSQTVYYNKFKKGGFPRNGDTFSWQVKSGNERYWSQSDWGYFVNGYQKMDVKPNKEHPPIVKPSLFPIVTPKKQDNHFKRKSIVLKWDASEKSKDYEYNIQIAMGKQFAQQDIVLDEKISETQREYVFPQSIKEELYYWRVRGCNKTKNICADWKEIKINCFRSVKHQYMRKKGEKNVCN